MIKCLNDLYIVLSVSSKELQQFNIFPGENDNETILNINQIIEDQRSKNLISKTLYLHVKGKFPIHNLSVHHITHTKHTI